MAEDICLSCSKAANTPGHFSKLPVAPGVDLFLVSLKSKADEVTHTTLALIVSQFVTEFLS